MEVQIRPTYEGFFFTPFISSGASTLSFSSTAICQRLEQREGLVCDGLCSILGSKRAFFGDAVFWWRVQDVAANLPSVCVGAMSTGREVVEEVGQFVQCSGGESLFSLTSQRCSRSLGTAQAAALRGQQQTDV